MQFDYIDLMAFGILLNMMNNFFFMPYCFQDFNVDALEKFVEEASLPIVTLFNRDPSNHPFVIKFFNSPNAKVTKFIFVLNETVIYYFFSYSNWLLLGVDVHLHVFLGSGNPHCPYSSLQPFSFLIFEIPFAFFPYCAFLV